MIHLLIVIRVEKTKVYHASATMHHLRRVGYF